MIRTAREVAETVSAQLEGDPDAKISGVASPESAGPEDLIYVDGPRHLERAAESRARCVLLPRGLELADRTILRTAQPKLAFARAAAWLLPLPPMVTGIHPTAIIAPSAMLRDGVAVGPYAVIEDDVQIGDGTQLGAHCFLGRGARIGERCRLYPRVTLYAGTRLGKNVIIQSGAVIGSDGFGYVFGEGRHWKFPQIGNVEIEDDVEIGSNTTIDRGALDVTRIGKGTKIDNLVQVAHNVQIGEHSIIAAQTGISGSSRIGNQVLIGGQVGIADGCHIRDGAIVGAQAGIPTGKTIPAGETVWGTPARPLVKFKEQYAWFARLPELGERIRKLEGRGRQG